MLRIQDTITSGQPFLIVPSFFHSRGWGILALPEESFVLVNTLEEMLGLPERMLSVDQPGAGCPQPMVNVAECLAVQHRQQSGGEVPRPLAPWQRPRWMLSYLSDDFISYSIVSRRMHGDSWCETWRLKMSLKREEGGRSCIAIREQSCFT